jgi:hypothetical protein
MIYIFYLNKRQETVEPMVHETLRDPFQGLRVLPLCETPSGASLPLRYRYTPVPLVT